MSVRKLFTEINVRGFRTDMQKTVSRTQLKSNWMEDVWKHTKSNSFHCKKASTIEQLYIWCTIATAGIQDSTQWWQTEKHYTFVRTFNQLRPEVTRNGLCIGIVISNTTVLSDESVQMVCLHARWSTHQHIQLGISWILHTILSWRSKFVI